MPTLHRHLFLAPAVLLCALAATNAFAQAEAEDAAIAPTDATWRANTLARCEQQYSVEQCQDEQFLEENFHINSLEIAHRAAARRSRLEREALRELTLQRVCNKSPGSNCAGAQQPALCATQIAQACSGLAKEAAYCQQNAKTQCAANGLGSHCVKQKSTLCPSLKKQPMEALLAKYPKLKPEQKIKLVNTAKQLDSQKSWFGSFLDWIW